MQLTICSVFLLGEENRLVLRLAGDRIDMSTVRFDIIDVHGTVLQSNIHTSTHAFTSARNATIKPPEKKFKIKLTGIQG